MRTALFAALTVATAVALTGCVQTVPARSTQQVPQLNTQFRTASGDLLRVTSRDGAAKPGKVTICLRNYTKRGKWKGMHWKKVKAKEARYVANGRNARACGTHPAKGTKTWHFYEAKALGIKKRVGSYRINQARHANRTIFIDWISG